MEAENARSCISYEYTPLHIACGFDPDILPDFEAAKKAIDEDPGSINAYTGNTIYTALHMATCSGSLEIVKLLLKHGADVEKVGERGETALGIAIENDHRKMVACLIEEMQLRGMTNDEIINYSNNFHEDTVFHLAASNSLLELLQWLLDTLGRSHLEARDMFGMTVLMAACQWNNHDMQTSPVLWSVHARSLILSTLSKCRTISASRGQSVLPGGACHSAHSDKILRGQKRSDVFEFLLHEGADPLVRDSAEKTILHHLATFHEGAVAIAREMLRRGVDIHAKCTATRIEDLVSGGQGLTALHVACKSWAIDMIPLLLSEGADPTLQDDYQRTPLHLVASRWGTSHTYSEKSDTVPVIVAKFLLDAAPEIVDVRDYEGNTALLAAAKNIDILFSTVQLLHQRGGNITATNSKRESALHLAVTIRGDGAKPCLSAMVKYLVENGVAIEARDNFGATPLFRACVSNSIGGVKGLLEKGANVNARCHKFGFGQTPLHMAYSKGFKDTIGKVLLEYGADPELRDQRGMTPNDLVPLPKADMGRGRGRGYSTRE